MNGQDSAFPTVVDLDSNNIHVTPGFTKRELIAKDVLAGLVAGNLTSDNATLIVESAIILTDELIKQLGETK